MERHRLAIWWSYYRGWLDAAGERVHGNISYSFDRFFVAGIAEYAAEVDGISDCVPPTDVAWAPNYLEGFNRRMEGAIRKRTVPDFPKDYVRRYLEYGWIDLSREQPATCPVHHSGLTVQVIPFEIVWPFTIDRPPFPWEEAKAELFPFSGLPIRGNASLPHRPRNLRVRVCEECTAAERQWWETHPQDHEWMTEAVKRAAAGPQG